MPNSVIDEGYVKYSAERIPGVVAWTKSLSRLDEVRTELSDLGLIGIYPNGIGFGNASLRSTEDKFFVTGTGTGTIRTLGPSGWCRVDWFSVPENRVSAFGPVDASSESMTHGSIYRASLSTRCILHVHNRRLWEHLLSSEAPRTAADIPYGTPAMANAVVELVRAIPSAPALFAMAGHDEGVVAYGGDIESTRTLILDTFRQARK